MERVGLDLEMTTEEKEDPQACQEDYQYRDVKSCHQRPYPEGYFDTTHYSNHQPFYEMRYDGTGEPFDNILEMRAAKIRNLLSTNAFKVVKELWILQYEELLRGGTAELIREIEGMTGVKAQCSASPPQDRKGRRIGKKLVEHMMKKLDWEAEALVGYRKTGLRRPKTNSTIYYKKISE